MNGKPSPETQARIRDLLDRLARIAAAEEWSDDLNPAQRAALDYLGRANRFSRAPSHVAEFLCTTRGTASQTLKALERKGLAAAAASDTDRRSVSYAISDKGQAALSAANAVTEAIADLTGTEAEALLGSLQKVTRIALGKRGGRAFGICRTCRHHRTRGSASHCALLDVPLLAAEVSQICHEHAA